MLVMKIKLGLNHIEPILFMGNSSDTPKHTTTKQ